MGPALAFVAGFPGAIGLFLLFAAFSRVGMEDGAFPLAVGCLSLAGLLLALGLRSFIKVGPDTLTVRFFGIRSTTVRFEDLVSATFGMAQPSISFAVTLKDRANRKVLIHANWWRQEAAVIRRVCQELLDRDVPMDRSTARLVASTLRVKRPKARIIHRAIFRKDRTW